MHAASTNAPSLVLLALLGLALAWLGCIKIPLPLWTCTETFVADKVGTGDLLLFRTGKHDFRLSSVVTRVVISHVGIAISAKDAWRDFGHAAPLVLECHSRCNSQLPDIRKGGRRAGVQLHALEHRIEEYARMGGTVGTRRLVGPPLRVNPEDVPEQDTFPSDWNMFLSGGFQLLRDRYGLRGRRPKVLDTLFCSPFVAHMYLRLRVLERCDMPEQLVYPDQFFDAAGGVGLDARLATTPAYHFDSAVRWNLEAQNFHATQ